MANHSVKNDQYITAENREIRTTSGIGTNPGVFSSNLSSQHQETSHTHLSNPRHAHDGNLQNRDPDSTPFTFSFAERENLDKLELSSEVFKKRKLESVEDVATYRTSQTSASSASIISNNNSTHHSASDAIFTYWPVPGEINDGSSTVPIDIDRAIATMVQLQARKSNPNSVATPSMYADTSVESQFNRYVRFNSTAVSRNSLNVDDQHQAVSAMEPSINDADTSVESQFNRYVRFNSTAVNRSSSNVDDQHQVVSSGEPLLRKEEMRKLMTERIARLKLEKLLRDKELAGMQRTQKNCTESHLISGQSNAVQTAHEASISGMSAAVSREDEVLTRSEPRLQSEKSPQEDEQVLRSALLRLCKRPFHAVESTEEALANHAVETSIEATKVVPHLQSRSEELDVCPVITADQCIVKDPDLMEPRTSPQCSDFVSDGELDSSDAATDTAGDRRIGENADIFETRGGGEHDVRQENEDDEVISHRIVN